jgi:short-subunit dehydrogenase
MKRVVIVGATSRIAECCARRWASMGAKLFLVARDQDRLQKLKTDLGVRCGHPEFLGGSLFDALDFGSYPRLVQSADEFLGGIDVVLIAHGTLPEQPACEQDLDLTRRALEVNGLSAVLLAEAFAMRMAPARNGTIAVIGSVAGDRGRRSNYVYGAAKALIHRYLEGMRHRLAPYGLQIVTIKPGPTDTPMTTNYKQPGVRLADPAQVADLIVDGIDRGRTTIYAPALWRWIMLVIRHIPERIFLRMKL